MLNARGVLDPRWAWHHRSVSRGAMWAIVTVLHPQVPPTVWNPLSDDPAARVFKDGVGTTGSYDHYKGRARLQPNNDWRARKNQWDGELVTEHAMRIQIDLNGNTITNPDKTDDAQPTCEAGLMHVGDIVLVTSLAAPYGRPADAQAARFAYSVRNISIGSNTWERDLLCDFVVNDVSNG